MPSVKLLDYERQSTQMKIFARCLHCQASLCLRLGMAALEQHRTFVALCHKLHQQRPGARKAHSPVQVGLNASAVVPPADLRCGNALNPAREVERAVDVDAGLAHNVHHQGLHCNAWSQTCII